MTTLPTPYYDDGNGIVIYHGDCRDILPLINSATVDLVLTDPPYDKEAHAPRRTRASLEGRVTEYRSPHPFDSIDEETRTRLVEESVRVGNGWVLVFCQAEAVGRYRDLFGELWRRPMVWVKPDSMPQFSGDKPAIGFESIGAAWVGGGRSHWNGGGKRGVFTHNCTGYRRDHPTQKPIPLMRELIELFSDPVDLVLDPFMGSGVSLRAAKDLGRRAIGIEIEERYCEVAVKRLQQSVMQFDEPATRATLDSEVA